MDLEKAMDRWNKEKSAKVTKSAAKHIAGNLLKIISGKQSIECLLAFGGELFEQRTQLEFRMISKDASDSLANTEGMGN